MTSFRWGSSTDAGRVRSVNQDHSVVVADRLFALADGMGGHQGGEVASEVALTVLGKHLTKYTTGDVLDAVREANRRVFQRAGADPDLKGMGTTLCAIALVDSDEGGERLALVNVGDSRVYRQRDEDLDQLTDDHSLVASLVKEGRLTPEEAATHPQRNVLTRALGIDSYVQVDSWELDAVTGDRYLLCSDGLFNEVEETRISSTLRRLDDPTDAARELVRLANEGGGRDNITCLIVDVVDGPGVAGRPGGVSTDTALHPVVPPAEAGDDDDAGPEQAADADGDGGSDSESDGTETDGPDPSSTGVMPAVGADDRSREGADDDDDAQASLGEGFDEDEADGADEIEDAAAPRRFTWRVLLFGLALVVLLASAAGAVAWYGRNTYFVSFDADEVVIFKGRPGGFLWFDPTEEKRSGIDRSDVPASILPSIVEGRDAATLADAERFVDNLKDQVGEPELPTTTTTTAPPRPASGGATTTGPPRPAAAP